MLPCRPLYVGICFLLSLMSVSCSNKRAAMTSFDKGVIALAEKDYDKAITFFTEAIEADPQNARAYNERGVAWSRKAEFDQAISEGPVVNDDRPVAFLARDEPDAVDLFAVVIVDVLPAVRLLEDGTADAIYELGEGDDGAGHRGRFAGRRLDAEYGPALRAADVLAGVLVRRVAGVLGRRTADPDGHGETPVEKSLAPAAGN
jgi:tetratricopeptide (TPR) repeat protein